eukprot:12175485-Alexandrium_andersonii.AAC.1
MVWPRACGQRVFWGLFDVYRLLSMTGFGGQPSKWTSSCIPRWKRIFEHTLPGDHFIMSKHANLSGAKDNCTPWHARCLPQAAVGTVAFV